MSRERPGPGLGTERVGRLESLVRRVERLAGGRHASYVVPAADAPAVRRVFRVVTVLLVVAATLGVGAVVVAVVLAGDGASVPAAVWLRTVVVLGITATLFGFLWRARLGYWWALRRLQLFSLVFPLVAVGLASIPGLYPAWLVVEQIVFAAVLAGVAVALRTRPIRDAFPRPSARDTAPPRSSPRD